MNTYIFVSHRNLSQCIRSKQTTQFESYWARVRFYHLVLAVFTFRFVRLSQVTRVVCPFVHTSMRWKMSGWKWAMWGDWYLNLVFSVCILRPFNFLTHSTWLFFVGLPKRPLNKKKYPIWSASFFSSFSSFFFLAIVVSIGFFDTFPGYVYLVLLHIRNIYFNLKLHFITNALPPPPENQVNL